MVTHSKDRARLKLYVIQIILFGLFGVGLMGQQFQGTRTADETPIVVVRRGTSDSQGSLVRPLSVSSTSQSGRAAAGPIEPDRIRVIDGDTIRVDDQRSDVRLVGINTPETRRAQCDAERELGGRATRRLRDLVSAGNLELRLQPCACEAAPRALRAATSADAAAGCSRAAKTWAASDQRRSRRRVHLREDELSTVDAAVVPRLIEEAPTWWPTTFAALAASRDGQHGTNRGGPLFSLPGSARVSRLR